MTPIYHITHIDNLEGIIQAGGLWSDAERISQKLETRLIGYPHIKERRMLRKIPVAAGGVLGAYVPFYFCPRSPMLYSIHTGNVINYQQGQQYILHLVSSVEKAFQLKSPWAFSNIHAELGHAEYYEDWNKKNELDWKVIHSNDWGGDERRQKKMAEFLIHRFFPWRCFHKIGVHDMKISNEVNNILQLSSHKPQISIEKKMVLLGGVHD